MYSYIHIHTMLFWIIFDICTHKILFKICDFKIQKKGQQLRCLNSSEQVMGHGTSATGVCVCVCVCECVYVFVCVFVSVCE